MTFRPGDFALPAPEVARRLIGCRLIIGRCRGMICETEAYTHDDPASHSFRGRTPRNAAMFGPAGHAYVYRSYGIHWCLNVVCMEGTAVLLRAIEPQDGLEEMRQRRGDVPDARLAAGPGRLGRALGIGPALNGKPFDHPEFSILPENPPGEVVAGPRIGISRAKERPWRFGLRGSASLSRPFPE
ncbi:MULTISPECIES: DNA-3-methyladenine glycosylase [Gemmobacter]|nr:MULTISPECIES: DNA-3-methyladenine glycosylase [Gemmobacter]